MSRYMHDNVGNESGLLLRPGVLRIEAPESESKFARHMLQ